MVAPADSFKDRTTSSGTDVRQTVRHPVVIEALRLGMAGERPEPREVTTRNAEYLPRFQALLRRNGGQFFDPNSMKAAVAAAKANSKGIPVARKICSAAGTTSRPIPSPSITPTARPKRRCGARIDPKHPAVELGRQRTRHHAAVLSLLFSCALVEMAGGPNVLAQSPAGWRERILDLIGGELVAGQRLVHLGFEVRVEDTEGNVFEQTLPKSPPA